MGFFIIIFFGFFMIGWCYGLGSELFHVNSVLLNKVLLLFHMKIILRWHDLHEVLYYYTWRCKYCTRFWVTSVCIRFCWCTVVRWHGFVSFSLIIFHDMMVLMLFHDTILVFCIMFWVYFTHGMLLILHLSLVFVHDTCKLVHYILWLLYNEPMVLCVVCVGLVVVISR